MLDGSRLLALAGVALAVIVVPGPGVLFIVGRGVSFGRRAAMATVVGHDLGLLIQVVLVAGGVGGVVERSIVVFDAIKLVGAGYLIWLGVQAIRRRGTFGAEGTVREAGSSLLGFARQGLIVGCMNPKSFLLFAAVLPQFVDPAAGAVQLQLVVLGLVRVAIALVSDSAWAVLAGTARSWLARSPRRIEGVSAAGGVVTIALGVRLALARRPS